jgi:hypothetical protein
MLSRVRWTWALTLLLSCCFVTPLSAQIPITESSDPLPNWWARGDYLLWTMQGQGTPPLLTGSAPGTTRARAGVLGDPNTTVLFGGQFQNNELRQGFMVEAGWMSQGDMDFPIGLFGNFFMLESKANGINRSSDGSAILARPFFNLNTGLQDTRLLAFPGVVSGTFNARLRSDLLGAELNLMQRIWGNDAFRLNTYIGYRYVRYRDSLDIQDASVAIDPLSVPGTTLAINETFGASTDFHGCNFGLDMRYHYDRWSVHMRTSLAVGYASKVIHILGQTQVTVPPNAPIGATGGLLALPSNITEFHRTDAAVVPQLALTFGYAVTDLARVTLGYDFLYLSDVGRGASQIDPVINTTQFFPTSLTGTRRPALNYQWGEVWAQGLRVGLEVVY